MTMERVLSGTALFAWAVVAQRLESLLGKDVAAPLLGDLRQYLLGRGFDQLLNLTNELTAQRRADSILNQACDLFEHRITQSNEPHLRRFAQLSLRKIEDIQLAINAFTIIPSQITLEQVVRNQLAAIHENDPVAQLALDEAVALFMECLDLALLAKGDQTVLLLKIEEILTQLRVLQAPTLLVVPIESDQLVVASEALFAREQDIEQAVTILDPRSSQGSNVLMLYGELGAGKSTLAREIGRRLRDSSAIKSIIIRDFPFHDKEETLYETFFSKLESKLGIRTIEGHIESRAARLQQELKDRSLLYIVDDVEYDITRRIVLFMQSLNAPNVRVLITQNTAPEQPGCMTLEIKELRNTEHIHTFLQNRCNNLLLSEAQVQHILNVTQGNLIALEELAKLINENGLDKTLPQIEEAIAGPGSTIAEKWLGYVLGKLSPLQILLIHAQCLFKRTAHVNMLVEIIRHYQRDAPTTERESTDDRKIRTAVKQLVARGIFLQAKDADRYSLKSTFLNYIRQELKRDKSLDGWRDGWIACYLELRQRQQNNDDIVGWTIMLDYTPDNASPIDPAHPHEAATIRDALTYCTDPKRIATRWEDAVRLLDSFRATLFAAGLWQVRIDAAIATLKYAKSTQSWHHVGQLQRMLAWMDCFRDKYGSGEELAQSAYALSCQHLAYGRTQAERVIHCQTMYKSLVSLGQLALRQGQEAAISGHYRQHDEAERANDLFHLAHDKFAEARGYAHHAQLYIRHAFPEEALVMDYFLAEIEYYDRHSLSMLREPQLFFKKLEHVRVLFENVSDKALAQEHVRLQAHVTYYLGKIHRRLATQRDYVVASAEVFGKAKALLDQAQQLAEKHNDTILLGRIAFAFGQYYESLIPADSGQPNQRTENLAVARSYVMQAIQAFDSDKMLLEMGDATCFLEQRLGTTI